MMGNSVKLTWGASSDNVGVTGYKILRDGSQIGGSVMPGYTDMTVAASTAYNYTVEAFDAASNVSSASNTATITTPAGGGGGGAGAGMSGNFVMGQFGWNATTQSFWDRMANLSIDSQGNFTSSPMGSSRGMGMRNTGMVNTTAEGLLYFDTLGGMAAHSADGNAFAWADTTPSTDSSLSVGLGFKNSGHMGRSSLSGTYVVGGVEMVQNGKGQVTTTPYLVNIQFKGNGKMSYRTGGGSGGGAASNSEGGMKAKAGSYTVASSGKVTMKVNGMQLQGFARGDGDVRSASCRSATRARRQDGHRDIDLRRVECVSDVRRLYGGGERHYGRHRMDRDQHAYLRR